MKVLLVRDIMSSNILQMDKDTIISMAVKEMIEKGMYAILVLDNNSPVGIVTERDFTIKLLSKNKDPNKEKLSSIMSSPLITIKPDDTIDNAAKLMVIKKIKKLPVLENNNVVGIVTEDDIIRIAPDLMILARQEVTDWNAEIIRWLTSGSDKSEDPVNLIWDVKIEQNVIVAEHPKIPFALHVIVTNRFVRMNVFTGLETALLEPIQRLDISRKLLFLNDRINLVKYVIRGINEEIVLSSELDLVSITKEEFNDALTGLITALFMMVKEFKLEEEFNRQVTERIILMVKERMEKGEKREDLLNFLVNKVGMDKNSAEKLLDEIIKSSQTYKAEDLSAYR